MSTNALMTPLAKARSDSDSTIQRTIPGDNHVYEDFTHAARGDVSIQTSLSIHNDVYSPESALFTAQCLEGSGLQEGDLVEIKQTKEEVDVHDFASHAKDPQSQSSKHAAPSTGSSKQADPVCLCLIKVIGPELAAKQHIQDVSMNKQIATLFGFTAPSLVTVRRADKSKWTSSHVEICFRDAYLSRSDMWRFTNQEMMGKPVYSGQKLTFLNSLKATVRDIHVHGRHARAAYFGNTTVPVFRSEAARYVIFIQMSREMWDFDSEGDGEILFNRVVNGFLPELFKRWSSLELRHLVSIVMFGRLEYRRSDIVEGQGVLSAGSTSQLAFSSNTRPIDHQDFYRVVVTDMASAQWTTILEELKKGFRVFLKEVCLFKTPDVPTHPSVSESQTVQTPRITGRLSGALRGNILEAINLAASQFSNDYIDRDLIRTGISTVIITAGSGVFDVDRELLRLTSETLTNNGIGIDIVCLSKMPLHSVPLFRYRLDGLKSSNSVNWESSLSPASFSAALPHPSLPDLSASPAFSSKNGSHTYFSRFPSAFSLRLPQTYGYGIPHWVDLSYWSSETRTTPFRRKRTKQSSDDFTAGDLFVPRVRMYELQMMGLMELGMADISIPFLNEQKFGDDLSLQKWRSQLSNSQYSRSLSRSPEMNRKNASATQMYASFRAQQDSGLSVRHAEKMMDEYDKSTFTIPTTNLRDKGEKRVRKQKAAADQTDTNDKKSNSMSKQSLASTPALITKSEADSKFETASISSSTTAVSKPARAPRNFSYGLKGLMPFKATAVKAEVQTQNVNAHSLAAPAIEDSLDDTRPKMSSRASINPYFPKHDRAEDSDSLSRPSTGYRSDDGTKPIRINASAAATPGVDSITKQLWQQRRHQRNQSELSKKEHTSGSETDSDNGSENEVDEKPEGSSTSSSSVPDSKIPFIRNVNASNPLKRKPKLGTFGRWQHLYPRKPRSAKVKWRSLCTPASVPLTTEGFPTRDELRNNYEGICHVVKAQEPGDIQEEPYKDLHSLLLEMISLRIAHGYQFVVGSAILETIGKDLADYQTICDTDAVKRPRLVVVLVMGNTIQKLELHKPMSIRVTKYVQKQPDGYIGLPSTIAYEPYIRSTLADDYFLRRLVFRGFSESYRWDIADNHLAGRDDNKSENMIEELRYWRARFVLLPVEPPAGTWKKHLQDESEEEIHLLGIRALTQMWQKNRYISAQDRETMQRRMGNSRIRDENPLEVKMETLNPSELIAMEMDKLTQTEERGEHEATQLLPETQKLDRETPMAKIAQTMQGEQGLDIKTRRWHWRLHYNCFRGEDFTTWLVGNVKNMNTREEAVEYGNQLMKEGLFEHVSGKHQFKDGHYFYSLKQQYRQLRPEPNKSWFSLSRQSDKSIPATPATEHPTKEFSPLSSRTRSGSNIALQLHTPASDKVPFTDKKRITVALSRAIRVDVDPRKKSFQGRPEVVNVHYDRFHNPDNCYHIWLDWFSTTSKLVDDAIVSWTNAADRFGLKLVEVPIAEAAEIPKSEPFRHPFRLKLALEPPRPKLGNITFNPVFSATSFAPLTSANPSNVDKHIYQKALLRRFNFVLDLEAASEFPDGVDIHYSWGKFNYAHTQFVHRTGVVLAQIMEDGDIILLANRLYSSRLVNTKEAQSRMIDPKRDSGPQSHRPAIPPTAAASMQASGIMGINLASPNSNVVLSPGLQAANLDAHLGPSPALNPSTSSQGYGSRPLSDSGKQPIADVFGPRPFLATTALWNTLITPEQIMDGLVAFCLDKARLEAFYKEVANAPLPLHSVPGSGSRKPTGSSSSSLLRPVKEVSGTSDIMGIPAFELPEAVTAVRELRRATVAYDSVSEMFDRGKIGSRTGSTESAGQEDGSGAPTAKGGQGGFSSMSPLRKATK